MDFLVDQSYLVFPLRKDAPERLFRFFNGDLCLGEYSFRYTEEHPDSVAYLDFRPFRNRKLRLECSVWPQLRQVEKPTVPLLHPENEPEDPFSSGEYDDLPLGRPIVRADTFYVNYAWSPCPPVWCRRELTLSKPYLALLTRSGEPMHVLRVLSDGKPEAEYLLRYCENEADFVGYLDLSRYVGKRIVLETDLPMKIEERASNVRAGQYREPWRPRVHFTVGNGWNNDPNGLILLDGVYHMFYQYGPLSLHWNNMHWGHAVSRDLIRWEELPAAICPHDRANIASGSAVLDKKNTSGLGEEGRAPVLLFYSDTADGWTQQLLYSTDGLKTLKRWEGNPSLPNLCASNRDPRVVFCEELGCWLMALYMDGDEYRLFRSDDLKNWSPLQTVCLPGDGECPDFYPILAENGERKWVFSGAHDRYFVGSFRDGLFHPEQAPERLSYGDLNYAAQTFSETLPEVKRICWQQTSDWASDASQQMGIATRLSLSEENGRYYLAAEPVAELHSLSGKTELYESAALSPDAPLAFQTEASAADLLLCPPESFGGKLTLTLFGLTVELDYGENRILLGAAEAPLAKRMKADKAVRLLIDKRSAEIFADGGTVYFAKEVRADFEKREGRLRTDRPLVLKTFSLTSLEGIWDAEKT